MPADETAVTLSIAPVIDDAGMPDSAGIVTDAVAARAPAGPRRVARES